MQDRRKNAARTKCSRYTAADWFVAVWAVAGLAVGIAGIWNLIWSF